MALTTHEEIRAHNAVVRELTLDNAIKAFVPHIRDVRMDEKCFSFNDIRRILEEEKEAK